MKLEKANNGFHPVKLESVITEATTGFACGRRADDGVIQIRMNNVTRRGELDWSNVLRVPSEMTDLESFALRSGDVLFNNTNSTEMVGKTACFDTFKEPVVFSNHFTRLRADKSKLDSGYLALWLHKQFLDGLFAKICDRWIGQSAVQRNKLLGLEISLPPVTEQRRIAARLREQMAEAERARAAVQAQLDAAQKLPAALLRAIFTSPAAHRWPHRRLGEVLEPRNDVVHPRNKPTGKATFVGLEHIEPHTGRRIGSIEIEKAEMTGRRAQFFKGDLVYGYLRPYLNKVWIAEFAGLCSVDQYVYQVNDKLALTPFVAAFMRSSTYLENAPIGDTPGQLPRIRMDEVAATEISLPTIAEQRAIAARLESELTAAHSLCESLETRLAEIERLPAALLRAAFSQAN